MAATATSVRPLSPPPTAGTGGTGGFGGSFWGHRQTVGAPKAGRNLGEVRGESRGVADQPQHRAGLADQGAQLGAALSGELVGAQDH